VATGDGAATFFIPVLYYTLAMTAPPDRDLIQRARRGDAEAFGELVTRYQTSVFNVCYRMTNEEGAPHSASLRDST
jgi:hypothetical protein